MDGTGADEVSGSKNEKIESCGRSDRAHRNVMTRTEMSKFIHEDRFVWY